MWCVVARMYVPLLLLHMVSFKEVFDCGARAAAAARARVFLFFILFSNCTGDGKYVGLKSSE